MYLYIYIARVFVFVCVCVYVYAMVILSVECMDWTKWTFFCFDHKTKPETYFYPAYYTSGWEMYTDSHSTRYHYLRSFLYLV